MKKLLSIVCFAFSALCIFAQSSNVEVFGGSSLQPFPFNGQSGINHCIFSGGNVHVRYTWFFRPNFGIYAQIGSDSIYGDEASFFGAMNKSDGEKYLYRFFGSNCYASDLSEFSIGAAWRWDSGIFRFTPRVALGIGSFYGYNYSYERRGRSGSSGPEYCSISPVRESVPYDYLIDSPESYYSPTPVLVSADFQISVFPQKRVYLLVQPGVTAAPFRIGVECVKYGSVHTYSPTNWVEAVAYSDALDLWTKDPESKSVSVDRCFIPPVFRISLGVGFNFGY